MAQNNTVMHGTEQYSNVWHRTILYCKALNNAALQGTEQCSEYCHVECTLQYTWAAQKLVELVLDRAGMIHRG